MRIKLDDKHYLNGDQYCCWISCEVVNEKTKKAYDKRVSGYYATFGETIASYIDKYIGGSDAETIEDLEQEIKQLKETVMGWKIAATQKEEQAK